MLLNLLKIGERVESEKNIFSLYTSTEELLLLFNGII